METLHPPSLALRALLAVRYPCDTPARQAERCPPGTTLFGFAVHDTAGLRGGATLPPAGVPEVPLTCNLLSFRPCRGPMQRRTTTACAPARLPTAVCRQCRFSFVENEAVTCMLPPRSFQLRGNWGCLGPGLYGRKRSRRQKGFMCTRAAVTQLSPPANVCKPVQLGSPANRHERHLCLAGLRLFSFCLEHILPLTETRLLRMPRATLCSSPEPHERDRGSLR